MSKFSKLGLRRAAGAVAIASAAVVGLAGMGAGDAAAGKLANGYKKASGIEGESIQTWRTGEFALPAPSVANNGAGRSAVVSGVYQAKASKGVSGNLAVKLLVGCQVDITGLSGGIGAGIDLTGAELSGALSIPLSPGQVALVDITDKDLADNGQAAIQLSQFEVSVQQCGGFASARTITKVIGAKGYSTDDGKVSGEGSLIQSTLYGQPFSLN
ncbi:MspA family porin [Gordonia alkanivorans]|uniref:MspA family porin n=1 Tax=Gordonia alkanivorans TaxID=84096 RepID=UPI00244C9E7A|nr:MspA family porin [Gordonia alkanivorans]MDH3014572.1 MspA family porin [Gordonia alkanivorans]MDH3039808.1 MspA family porin [Gordonia alkanivorans]